MIGNRREQQRLTNIRMQMSLQSNEIEQFNDWI